ncbi:uncharacterized protein FIBRA_04725 [Fibroporia radiculosa]|uniref:NTF2 domain-containing protein n=1 Tax=Fibroporia radiculosa TaxID=599839 RepID=J4HWP5_9APHY|nr:uncharacterized protein FIBRA_04725 [Fibroporia radiculosa]CCM02622.1 predicted protein [Fibroporia radiculosa]
MSSTRRTQPEVLPRVSQSDADRASPFSRQQSQVSLPSHDLPSVPLGTEDTSSSLVFGRGSLVGRSSSPRLATNLSLPRKRPRLSRDDRSQLSLPNPALVDPALNDFHSTPKSEDPSVPDFALMASPPPVAEKLPKQYSSLKRERSPTPTITDEPKLTAGGVVRLAPLPDNCQKTNANYASNRNAWIKDIVGRMKRVSDNVKIRRAFTREDGIAIDWTSNIPVHPDIFSAIFDKNGSLRPDNSANSEIVMVDDEDLVPTQHSLLSSNQFVPLSAVVKSHVIGITMTAEMEPQTPRPALATRSTITPDEHVTSHDSRLAGYAEALVLPLPSSQSLATPGLPRNKPRLYSQSSATPDLPRSKPPPFSQSHAASIDGLPRAKPSWSSQHTSLPLPRSSGATPNSSPADVTPSNQATTGDKSRTRAVSQYSNQNSELPCYVPSVTSGLDHNAEPIDPVVWSTQAHTIAIMTAEHSAIKDHFMTNKVTDTERRPACAQAVLDPSINDFDPLAFLAAGQRPIRYAAISRDALPETGNLLSREPVPSSLASNAKTDPLFLDSIAPAEKHIDLKTTVSNSSRRCVRYAAVHEITIDPFPAITVKSTSHSSTDLSYEFVEVKKQVVEQTGSWSSNRSPGALQTTSSVISPNLNALAANTSTIGPSTGLLTQPYLYEHTPNEAVADNQRISGYDSPPNGTEGSCLLGTQSNISRHDINSSACVVGPRPTGSTTVSSKKRNIFADNNTSSQSRTMLTESAYTPAVEEKEETVTLELTASMKEGMNFEAAAVEFLNRYLLTFNKDRSLLAGAYSRLATFSVLYHDPSGQFSALSGRNVSWRDNSKLDIFRQGRPEIIVNLLSLPADKFGVGDWAKVYYDVVSLHDASVLLMCYADSEVSNQSCDQRFVLRPREWDEEDKYANCSSSSLHH